MVYCTVTVWVLAADNHTGKTAVATLLLPSATTTSPTLKAGADDAGAADWVTVTLWPPALTVPVRDAAEPFAAAVHVRLPELEPLPDALSQPPLLDALHGQPVVVVTAIVPEPPEAPIAIVGGASVYAHDVLPG